MEELKNALTLVNIYNCLVHKHGLLKYERLLVRWKNKSKELQGGIQTGR